MPKQPAAANPEPTLEALRQQALRHHTKSLAAIFTALSEGLVIHGADGRVIEANPAAEKLLGLSRDALLGKTSIDPRWRAIHEDGQPYPGDRHPAMLTLRSGVPLNNQIMGIDDPQRGVRWISINASPIWGDDALQPQGVVATFVDITERREDEARTHRLALEQNAMLDNDLIGIVKLRQRRAVWVNRAMCRIFGYAAAELLGLPARILYPSDASWQALGDAAYPVLAAGGRFRSQLEMVRKNGERLWIDANGVMLDTGGEEAMWFLADITDLKRYQDACEFQAHSDPLTGLPNRVLLADRMDQALALAQRHGYVTALCYLDLDGFKAINDEHGHDAGDEVLKEVARRLQAVIRENDTAARLGGDEFVLLLTHVGSPQEVERLLQRVLDTVATPVATDVALVGVTASIGVAMAPAQGLDGPGLLRRADTAMYAAKRLGRRQMHFFRDAPHAGPGSIH